MKVDVTRVSSELLPCLWSANDNLTSKEMKEYVDHHLRLHQCSIQHWVVHIEPYN